MTYGQLAGRAMADAKDEEYIYWAYVMTHPMILAPKWWQFWRKPEYKRLQAEYEAAYHAWRERQ